MTDLMKRYEAETGKVMSRLMEIFADAEKHSKEELINVMTELYMYGLHLEAQLTGVLGNKTIEKFQEIIRSQCDEISALKAQLTWRPVTQRPRKEGWYLCKVHYVNDTIGEETVHFDGENFVFGNVSHWLPIPPAPEGEVKMLVDKNGKEITAGCKVMWGGVMCDVTWVDQKHSKEVQELCAKHMEVVEDGND